MQKPSDDGPVKPNIQARSMDERADAAVMLLKGLNPLQVQADQDGFSFLSYLLRMAIMEAQEIASGPTLAVEINKRLAREGMQRNLTEQIEAEEYLQAITHKSEDAKEGRLSFMEKRDPVFKGR